MKKFTYPLFVALVGFSSLTQASTIIIEDETAITESGQEYFVDPVMAPVDVSDYLSSSGISFTLDIAGDYSYDGPSIPYFEGLTFKLDDYTLAEWSDSTEAFIELEDPLYGEDYNYYSFSKTFEADTVIGTTTFRNIWELAAADGQVKISWFNAQEVDDLTNPSHSNLYDYVKYDFSYTAPVPEPSTYALMLAGLGLVGFMANRRRKV